jgi:hypothetical protein
MNIGADGEVTNSVTLENADELKTRKVGKNGQVYLGTAYAGHKVQVVFRSEGMAEDELDESDTEDSGN